VLENYQNVSFDVIVLDMHMPRRTGLEVAKVIRLLEANGRTRRMPIIMLMAAASTDLREDSLDAVSICSCQPVDPRAVAWREPVFSPTGWILECRHPYSDSTVEAGYVDRVLLQDMAGLVNDSQFIQTLTSKFSTDAGKPIDEIDAAPLQKDYGQFRGLVHALKGAAMMAGAIRLRESVARAERGSPIPTSIAPELK
jgi:CheY-like chemotaxis protein